jgi:Yip1 domain
MILVERAKNILLQPRSEWAVIEKEQIDARTLYTKYIAILAIIPAVASLIILSGGRTGMGLVLGSVITQYALGLVMVYAVAFIANILAPIFEGKRESAQALKLTAYAMTASWVAGVFAIVPGLGWLLSFLGSLYSIYLFFLGAPTLMNVPERKAVSYSIVVMVAAIVLGAVIGFIGVSIMGFGATGTMMRPREF